MPKAINLLFQQRNQKKSQSHEVIYLSLHLVLILEQVLSKRQKGRDTERERWARRVTGGVAFTRVMDDVRRMPCQQRGEDKYLAAMWVQVQIFFGPKKDLSAILCVCGGNGNVTLPRKPRNSIQFPLTAWWKSRKLDCTFPVTVRQWYHKLSFFCCKFKRWVVRWLGVREFQML